MSVVRRINLERTGARVVLALAVVTLLVVGVSAVMRIAAEDLYSSVNAIRGTGDVAPRTVYSRWLSAQLSADVAHGDLDAQHARADELSFRSDRLRELAAVPAVIGLLVALLTDSPEAAAHRRRAPARSGAPTRTSGAA
jgi:hypothetical protein